MSSLLPVYLFLAWRSSGHWLRSGCSMPLPIDYTSRRYDS